MTLIDLTHPISPDMPVYPGTEQPLFITGCSLEEDGFLEHKITLYSHTGTHMDAPAHLLAQAPSLEQLPIEQFYGSAIKLDLTQLGGDRIDLDHLRPYQQQIAAVDFVLLHTGWDRYWGTSDYFDGFPVLSLEAAGWLSTFKLKGIGLDTISADSTDTETYPVHKELLSNTIVIVENLTQLNQLSAAPFTFCCFPLKFEQADGSPIRAVACIE